MQVGRAPSNFGKPNASVGRSEELHRESMAHYDLAIAAKARGNRVQFKLSAERALHLETAARNACPPQLVRSRNVLQESIDAICVALIRNATETTIIL